MKELQQQYIIQDKKPLLFEHFLNSIHEEACNIGSSSIINTKMHKHTFHTCFKHHHLVHVLKDKNKEDFTS